MTRVLALNGGSSSLKYAWFASEREEHRGLLDRIGSGGPKDHAEAVRVLFEEARSRGLDAVDAIGHRIVHGGPDHAEPERVTKELLASLQRAISFAPLHLPNELALIRAAAEHFRDVPQAVSFDTAFHRTMPEVAQRFALPRSLHEAGLRRYGFHGLSYEFVVGALGDAAAGRLVIAHLGSGASMVATQDGRSIDTTMGFTPTGGFVMGTRSGDLDPGLLIHLLQYRGYDADSLTKLVNHEAGLLALSERTADMQKLLAAAPDDPRAELAVEAFAYGAAKSIGALAASLAGIDRLVFTGGIGEHAPAVRARICRRLAHLGIVLDETRNGAGMGIIAADGSACDVRVIATNEERVIARHTMRVLSLAP